MHVFAYACVPYTCVAICMCYCHMYVLPFSCVAKCMCFHMHVRVAIFMCCHMHVLPELRSRSYACVAIGMGTCHVHVLP